ncbi:YlbE-like family protein [Gracilibacillus caseinilyticus]|uniref:YlbE-like family protein n=1 Tax=Gracilibacillus caseinilyticus TaxID=2932256 RepID=A0ABY4EU81_9BACI|nr:YlbE-like family protein [Gracilibacillus caseinilyticus]UOQ47979.1 YlbE-like family protein [Gracilibacillus caseinilyticus]
MEPETYRYIQQRTDLWRFIRLNPDWYRYLSRNPERVREMEKEAKQFYGKTIPQRLARTQQNIHMVRLLMQMAGSWND